MKLNPQYISFILTLLKSYGVILFFNRSGTTMNKLPVVPIFKYYFTYKPINRKMNFFSYFIEYIKQTFSSRFKRKMDVQEISYEF